MSFLGDPGWVGVVVGIIGVIVAIIAIFVAIRIAKPRKALSYEIIGSYPVVDIHDNLQGRIKILLDDEKIENLYLTTISVGNDGKISINPGDYEKPMTISFDENANIVSCDIVEFKPDSLEPKYIISDDKKSIIIPPILLNEKDYFIMKIIGISLNKYPNVVARISGIKEVKRLERTGIRLNMTLGELLEILFQIVARGIIR